MLAKQNTGGAGELYQIETIHQYYTNETRIYAKEDVEKVFLSSLCSGNLLEIFLIGSVLRCTYNIQRALRPLKYPIQRILRFGSRRNSCQL